MKNQVIKVLNPEHGKQVIAYWKSKGANTRHYTGRISKEDAYCYYGIIDEYFSNYKASFVLETNTEIITLPFPTYGEEIIAWDDDEECCAVGKFSSMGHPNEHFPVRLMGSQSIDGKHNTSRFKHWKFIPKSEFVELTIQDISDGKGVGVPPHLIRIKK